MPPEPLSPTPVDQWYQCAWYANSSWSSEGLEIRNTAPTVQCATSHLTAFTVLPLITVEQATGCARDVSPSALHCQAGTNITLTVHGRQFGSAGATVELAGLPSGAAQVECVTVSPAPQPLLCSVGWSLGSLGLTAGPVVATLTLTAGSGIPGALPAAVVFDAPAWAQSLVPVAHAACTAAPAALSLECSAVGAAFGVTGVHLVGWGRTRIAVGPYICPHVLEHSPSYVECHGLSGVGQDHPVSVWTGQEPPPPPQAPLRLSFRCRRGWYGPSCALACPTMEGQGGGGARPVQRPRNL